MRLRQLLVPSLLTTALALLIGCAGDGENGFNTTATTSTATGTTATDGTTTGTTATDGTTTGSTATDGTTATTTGS
ncbi:hypothetical protein EON81_29235, partial [bacterium]